MVASSKLQLLIHEAKVKSQDRVIPESAGVSTILF